MASHCLAILNLKPAIANIKKIIIQIFKLTAISIRLHHRVVRIHLTLELKTVIEGERTLMSGVDVLSQ